MPKMPSRGPMQRYPNGVIVCVTKGSFTPFRDDVTAECADCGCAIVHRPYDPADHAKICMDCGEDILAELAASGSTIRACLLPQAVTEIETWLKRRTH